MSPEKSYSDREVALVLRRAAEIESVEGGSGGVAESDIVAIASEAGIGREAVERALFELGADAAVSGGSFFPPASRRSSRDVAGHLDREGLAALVRSIEDRTGRPGTVTEALETVRWTSASSFSTMQVSLSSEDERTTVGVHERLSERTKRLSYIIPTQIVAMGGLITAGSLGLGNAGLIGVLGAGALVGLAAGREVFRRLSTASRRRVDELAAHLGDAARRLGGGRADQARGE